MPPRANRLTDALASRVFVFFFSLVLVMIGWLPLIPSIHSLFDVCMTAHVITKGQQQHAEAASPIVAALPRRLPAQQPNHGRRALCKTA